MFTVDLAVDDTLPTTRGSVVGTAWAGIPASIWNATNNYTYDWFYVTKAGTGYRDGSKSHSLGWRPVYGGR